MTYVDVYNSQHENDEIYKNSSDLVLEKKSDNSFEVYIAVFDENENYVNFAMLNPKRGKLVGRIVSLDGKAIWEPV